MKKYCFALLTASVLLSGCEGGSHVREYVEFDPPHLTTMTTAATTVPVDTYSEYMETYSRTSAETTDSNRFYYLGGMAAAGANGVNGDTMATVPTVGPIRGVTADTPMTTTTTAPPITEEEPGSLSTETVSTEAPSEEGGTETVTATAETAGGLPTDTAYRDTPASNQWSTAAPADTAFSNNVTGAVGQKETVPPVTKDTMFRNTTKTTNGGTDNADQHS